MLPAGPPRSNTATTITVECASPGGTPVTVPLPAADDACEGPVTVVSDAPSLFPAGTTTVTFTATDSAGNSVAATTTVTVADTTPPVLQCNTPASIPEIDDDDPPVSFTATAVDACDLKRVKIRRKSVRCLGGDDDCAFAVDGATITFFEVDDDAHAIRWRAKAVDVAGNVAAQTCRVDIVGGDDDDSDSDSGSDSDSDSD